MIRPSTARRLHNLGLALGPGILFAAAAVGVSHLVQSTRAGADYGFGLAGVILLALILKYPFFEFGSRYTAATGKSLIDGYKTSGPFALIAFLVIVFLTMFGTLAAVTVVTAALAASAFGTGLSVTAWSAIILGLIAALLGFGRYALLDKVIKVLMVLLVIATVVAAILAAHDPGPPVPFTLLPEVWDGATIAFVIALVGWMPSPVEVSVFLSLWVVGRRHQTGHAPTLKEALFDFNLGYLVTGITAFLFLALGAWVMFGVGDGFPTSAAAFSDRLIDLYVSVIGDWSRPIVIVAALAAMFSTTMAVADAYPRIWRRALQITVPNMAKADRMQRSVYWICLLAISGAALLIITVYAEDLPALVDLATSIAFVTVPLLAYLNYRAVTHASVPEAFQPSRAMRLYAWVGIVCLTAFALVFVWWRFG